MADFSFLRRCDLASEPLEQFEKWLQQAKEGDLHLPEAMTLTTASKNAVPSARIVMLRNFDRRGFVFFTDYRSPKAQELDANPHAALVFYWGEQGRQVRISGAVEKISQRESQRYFATRPRESRIEAWTSHQSEVVSGREVLERRFREISEHYRDLEIPLPPTWGGFRVIPREIEFWQSGRHRMHDRFRYKLSDDGIWLVERLSP